MNLNEYLSQLETLVNIDCGSYNPDGIKKVADYLCKWYEEINWHIKKHDILDQTPVLEISNHKDADYYDALFIGHMDTVFPDGTVKNRPFRMKDDICYGPGVNDMKNGVLAMLHIAKNLNEITNDKLNICMCYNPDEEIGSRYSEEILKQIGSKAKRIFVMESSQDGGSGHVFNRKGKVNYTISFHGISGHAGYVYESENASAIQEMARFIVEIYKLKDKDKETSINVGIVEGGSAVNTVAEYGRIELESRFNYKQERDRIVNAINKMVNDKPSVDGVKIKIDKFSEALPWKQSEEGLEYIKHVEKLANDMGMKFYEKKRGGLSDANHLSEVCPIILDGMGPCGSYAHSEKECMYISTVEPCINLFEKILDDLVE